MNDNTKWWSLKESEVFTKTQTGIEGLSSTEASQRSRESGPNQITSQKNASAFTILLDQFKNWLVLMLLAAAILSFFLGQEIDGVVIIALVGLSVLFSFFQEYKAEKIITDLKKFITEKSRVKRDGKWVEVDTQDLVVGDVVEVRIGNKVPADIRFIETDNLAMDESTLTGESLPVVKSVKSIVTKSDNPANLKNMGFMGTLVAEGRGIGVVVAISSDTFFGKSAKSLETPAPETDFQKQIRNFSLLLFRVVMIMTLFIFAANTLLKKDVLESFLFALALAVGITPEMLPAIITITLSAGAMKMAKKKVVVKRLISVEDFGNVDTLCTDKTGTITEGKFSLKTFINLDQDIDEHVLMKAVLCTSGQYEKMQDVQASPVDSAILTSSSTKVIQGKLKAYKLIDENVFDYQRKRMSVLVKKDGKEFLIAKGAHESIMDVSTFAQINGERHPINSDVRSKIMALVDSFEEKSYRVIAVAEKEMESKKSGIGDERDLTLLGLLLFEDPIKDSAKEAIKKFTELGVSLKVLSGDSLAVTRNIARDAGIVFKDDEIITGDDLEKISATGLLTICQKVKVFARVTPEQKYKIVRALNYEGHIVGFMGDGVNDVPAIRAADVGISVDTAVDIAKDAADIILLEKDLKILSEGIQGGRKTFGNIMKYILNTISANYGNMFTVAAVSVFIKFIPMLPSQILLNNFISDVPLFAVATDNVDRNFVQKPKRWNITYIKNFMIFFGLVSSLFDMILILPMLFILHTPENMFQTAWFVESSISEMIITFAIRTRLPFYKSKPSSWLLWLSLFSIGSILAMPILKLSVFSFTSLTPAIWVLILIDLISYFLLVEFVKRYFFRRFELEQ